jgi:hypothetical protein
MYWFWIQTPMVYDETSVFGGAQDSNHHETEE